MEKLVLENEKQIEQFDIKYYIEHKKFPIASALCALEATNEIQKAYFEKEFPFDQVSEKFYDFMPCYKDCLFRSTRFMLWPIR